MGGKIAGQEGKNSKEEESMKLKTKHIKLRPEDLKAETETRHTSGL